jgi:hypothetical protein
MGEYTDIKRKLFIGTTFFVYSGNSVNVAIVCYIYVNICNIVPYSVQLRGKNGHRSFISKDVFYGTAGNYRTF